MNQRFDRSKFHIGAYILQPYANTERHIKALADCGIDTVVCMHNCLDKKTKKQNRRVLDLLYKYGVTCFMSGVAPGWWGGNGGNAGLLEKTNPMSAYENAAQSFIDHPAISGIDIGDEPSALDFPYYGKVADRVSRLFPHQFAYLNLYPNYASVAKNNSQETENQLGTATYAEHIDRYCQYVPLDYICYDFYVYSAKDVFKMYDNFRIVSNACRKTGRSFWYVPQVNSSDENEHMNENRLRFQAYTALAYGAEALYWACYTGGWWYHNVLDKEGNKNKEYDMLKKVNHEIRGIVDTYMQYRNVSTHLIGFETDDTMLGYADPLCPSLSTGTFFDVHAVQGEKLVIGQMVAKNNDGSQALMICAADDPFDTDAHKKYTVCFRADNRSVYAVTGHGINPLKQNKDGSYTLPIESCDGVLVIAK